jgi:hypothetical protein
LVELHANDAATTRTRDPGSLATALVVWPRPPPIPHPFRLLPIPRPP